MRKKRTDEMDVARSRLIGIDRDDFLRATFSVCFSAGPGVRPRERPRARALPRPLTDTWLWCQPVSTANCQTPYRRPRSLSPAPLSFSFHSLFFSLFFDAPSRPPPFPLPSPSPIPLLSIFMPSWSFSNIYRLTFGKIKLDPVRTQPKPNQTKYSSVTLSSIEYVFCASQIDDRVHRLETYFLTFLRESCSLRIYYFFFATPVDAFRGRLLIFMPFHNFWYFLNIS